METEFATVIVMVKTVLSTARQQTTKLDITPVHRMVPRSALRIGAVKAAMSTVVEILVRNKSLIYAFFGISKESLF